jgi:hypothetical protein
MRHAVLRVLCCYGGTALTKTNGRVVVQLQYDWVWHTVCSGTTEGTHMAVLVRLSPIRLLDQSLRHQPGSLSFWRQACASITVGAMTEGARELVHLDVLTFWTRAELAVSQTPLCHGHGGTLTVKYASQDSATPRVVTAKGTCTP